MEVRRDTRRSMSSSAVQGRLTRVLGAATDRRRAGRRSDLDDVLSPIWGRPEPSARPDLENDVGGPGGVRAMSTTIAQSYVVSGSHHGGAARGEALDLIAGGHRAAADLGAATADFSPPWRRRLERFLRPDLLARKIVELDFPGQRVVLHDAASFEPAAAMMRMALVHGRDGEPCVSIDIGGPAPILARLDPCGPSPLMVSSDYVERAGLGQGRRASTFVRPSVDGFVVGAVFTIPQLTIGGVAVEGVPLDAIPTGGPDDVFASVGLPLLEKFRAVLDYRGGAIWLQPSEVSPPGFRKDHSGLGLAILPDRLHVLHVGAGSPAEAEGWTAGEEIFAVDGAGIGPDYEASGLWRWRGRNPGGCVELTLRDGRRRGLQMTEYF
jgi:hypothetical protein